MNNVVNDMTLHGLGVPPPVAGHSLKTTLDLPLQQESEKALREGIAHARAGGKPATGGAFVAMDPRNGEVLAIGSYPGFDPNRFAKPLTPSEYAELTGGGPEAHDLAARISQAWINFARHGDPNHKDLPKWPAFQASTVPTMIFDAKCEMKNNPDGEARQTVAEA